MTMGPRKFVFVIGIFIWGNSFATTSPREAYEEVKKEQAVLVDVREKDELKSGMIDRAQWFPKSKIQARTNWESGFKDIAKGKKVYLYCKSGKRSKEVQEVLLQRGYRAESIGGYEKLKNILPSRRGM